MTALKDASPEAVGDAVGLVTVITSVKEKAPPLKADGGPEHVAEMMDVAVLEPLQMSVPVPNSVLLASAKKLQFVVVVEVAEVF